MLQSTSHGRHIIVMLKTPSYERHKLMILKVLLMEGNITYICLKTKGEKLLLVPTFSGSSHFSPYISFLPFFVPILKIASRFGPCRYIRNGES